MGGSIIRVIPVIDIRRGIAVHARRGARTAYRPLRSALLNGNDPRALLRAYCTSLQSTSVYVADLDALMGLGDNLAVIAEMAAAQPHLELLVDSGVRRVDDARRLLQAGANKVIIASEVLPDLTAASRLLAQVGSEKAIFSIDLRNRTAIWGPDSIESADPHRLAALLMPLGFREAILLEMERIGTGRGADAAFLADVATAAPGMKFIVGGGIRTRDDLLRLQRAGFCGVLVATALHDGTITREDVIRVEANPQKASSYEASCPNDS